MTLVMRNKLPDNHPIARGFVSFVPRRTDKSDQNSLPWAKSPADPTQNALDQIERAVGAKTLQTTDERTSKPTDAE